MSNCVVLRFPTAPSRSLILALLVVAAVPTACPAQQAGPIRWVDSPARALEISRQTGRKVVAYVSSERCGYCRKMERETWADPQIARLVSERYVPLRLSASRHRNEVRSLRVRAYPTTVLLTPSGEGLTGATGYLPPERLARLLDDEPSPGVVAARTASFGL